MQHVFRYMVCVWFGAACFPVRAAFTSLYAFGDGVCTTTNSPGGAYYYGNRYCNGRVWVEVLAERQGLTYESNKNWSYFGHYSQNLVTNLNTFVPTNAGTALFAVWVNNADFVYDINNYAPFSTNNLATWTNAINRSLSNHLTVIQILYAKGARTLTMPNAADLTKVPYYAGRAAADKSFIRQRIVDFNIAFAARLNQARASFQNLTIYSPDVFALMDNLIAHPGDYGLTNALDDRGLSIDAVTDPTLADKSLNGPGANYIFWDYLDPTARTHVVLADASQQLLAPVRINRISPVGGSNRLDIANVPIGRNGFVDAGTNLMTWTSAQSFNSTNATQTILVPATDPREFYRLRFPFSWSWP